MVTRVVFYATATPVPHCLQVGTVSSQRLNTSRLGTLRQRQSLFAHV
jgi:hypothetical protein